MKEFLDLLSEYVRGTQPLTTLAEWLAGVNWDYPKLTKEEQEVFGLFELLTTDVSEGLRAEEELISEAVGLLTKERRSVFLRDINAQVTIVASCGDKSTTVAPMTGDDQGQQSWSISPLLVAS